MNNIREMRDKRRIGFSQYHLARLSGVSQKRISLIERELVKPSEGEKKKIAAALGVEVDAIFPEVRSDSGL